MLLNVFEKEGKSHDDDGIRNISCFIIIIYHVIWKVLLFPSYFLFCSFIYLFIINFFCYIFVSISGIISYLLVVTAGMLRYDVGSLVVNDICTHTILLLLFCSSFDSLPSIFFHTDTRRNKSLIFQYYCFFP